MRVTDIRVGAVIYTLTASEISFMGLGGDGRRQLFTAGETRELIPKLGQLHDELSDGYAVARGSVPHLRDFIENWGRRLLPPATWLKDFDVLILVPQGDIHSIPLHMVRCDNEPLGTRLGITYTSGLALMSRCMSRNPRRRDKSAGCYFENDSPAACEPSALNAIVGGVDVLGQNNEFFKKIAAELAGCVKGEVLDFYSRISLKTVFRRPEMSQILCIVAHGYMDFNNHRMSGLLLAREQLGVLLRNIPLHGGRYFDFRDLPLRELPASIRPKMEAEILTSAELEIEGVLESEIVVLLGCSTSVGRLFPGDEPASLAETFLHIGASSVIASLWDVDLDFAEKWCRRFFEAWLNDHLPKALAFKKVMREMMEEQWRDKPARLGCMMLKGDWL